MDFKELINKRYSVRKYKDQKVERELIEQVLVAGQTAPSACNKQPWHFVVIDEPTLLQQMQQAYTREWFKSAPSVIIAYKNNEEAWVREYDDKNHGDVDVAIAVDHMSLMATELGLGTCWICHFDPAKLSSVIQIEQKWQAVAILTIGYDASDNIPHKKRKELNDIVSYNQC